MRIALRTRENPSCEKCDKHNLYLKFLEKDGPEWYQWLNKATDGPLRWGLAPGTHVATSETAVIACNSCDSMVWNNALSRHYGTFSAAMKDHITQDKCNKKPCGNEEAIPQNKVDQTDTKTMSSIAPRTRDETTCEKCDEHNLYQIFLDHGDNDWWLSEDSPLRLGLAPGTNTATIDTVVVACKACDGMLWNNRITRHYGTIAAGVGNHNPDTCTRTPCTKGGHNYREWMKLERNKTCL